MRIQSIDFSSGSRRAIASGLLVFGAIAAGGAQAARSDGCEGGGFTILNLRAPQDTSIAGWKSGHITDSGARQIRAVRCGPRHPGH